MLFKIVNIKYQYKRIPYYTSLIVHAMNRHCIREAGEPCDTKQ